MEWNGAITSGNVESSYFNGLDIQANFSEVHT